MADQDARFLVNDINLEEKSIQNQIERNPTLKVLARRPSSFSFYYPEVVDENEVMTLFGI